MISFNTHKISTALACQNDLESFKKKFFFFFAPELTLRNSELTQNAAWAPGFVKSSPDEILNAQPGWRPAGF